MQVITVSPSPSNPPYVIATALPPRTKHRSFRPPSRIAEIDPESVLNDDGLIVLVVTNGRERRWLDVSCVDVLDFFAVREAAREQCGWEITHRSQELQGASARHEFWGRAVNRAIAASVYSAEPSRTGKSPRAGR